MMRQNIEQVVGRGEHLEHLVDKSEGFSANAKAFQKDSSHLRKALWWKNMRMMAMMCSLMLGIGLAVLWYKCGLNLSVCRAPAA